MNEHDRFPRTMEEAFGPGHHGDLQTGPDPVHPNDKLVLAGCAAAVVVLVILFLVGAL